MTPLRQRMLDAMTVRGLAERTKECYVDAVARLARHYHRSPDQLSPPEIEAYLLHLVKDRKLSYSSVNHAASASRFLFETVLGRASDVAQSQADQGVRTVPRVCGSAAPRTGWQQFAARCQSGCGQKQQPTPRLAQLTHDTKALGWVIIDRKKRGIDSNPL